MKIYIAEDEPLAAAKLKLFLEKLGEGGDVTHFSDGSKLIEALNDASVQPDLVFMDIQMPHLTGLEVLQRLNAHRYPIILTTAYDKYAIDGFNFGVADYLLKPYTLDRLKQALQKARLLIQATEADEKPNKGESQLTEEITIRSEGRNERVDISAIECLEALKDYTRLHLSDGRQLTTLGTLTSFEQQLPASQFMRVHRSYIVNIKKVQSYSTQTLRLQIGLELPIGKTAKDSFIEKVQKK